MVTDFQALFEGLPGLYLALDATAGTNFPVVAVSDTFVSLTGVTRTAVVGRSIFDVFPDDPNDAHCNRVANLWHSLETVAAQGLTHAMALQKHEVPIAPTHGGGFETHHWKQSNIPIKGENGKVRYVLHQVEDVTEAIMLDQQRQRSAHSEQTTISGALEPAADPEIVVEGDPSLPLVLVVEDNEEMSEFICYALAGYRTMKARDGREGLRLALRTPPDLIVTDVIMPGMSGTEMVAALRARRELDSVPVVVLTARADQELRVKLLRVGAQDYLVKPFSPLELSARVGNLVKVKKFQEQLEAANCELKATQVQLVHSAKMASLGQLVAGIAHEVNNPLAYTLSNLSSITDWVAQLTPAVTPALGPHLLARWEKVRLRLASAQEGLDRVKDLVLKLRTFSRLDEGEFKTVEIPDTIESVLSFLEHRLGGRIALVRQYGPRTRLACFPGGLNQVVMNLVSNAIDSIEGDGTIAISTSCDEEKFSIVVSDSGCGLSEAVMDKLFEPFFTTKPTGDGTGLGLSISFAIMQSHRGAIRARNLPEGGSQFTLEIPLDLEERLSAA